MDLVWLRREWGVEISIFHFRNECTFECGEEHVALWRPSLQVQTVNHQSGTRFKYFEFIYFFFAMKMLWCWRIEVTVSSAMGSCEHRTRAYNFFLCSFAFLHFSILCVCVMFTRRKKNSQIISNISSNCCSLGASVCMCQCADSILLVFKNHFSIHHSMASQSHKWICPLFCACAAHKYPYTENMSSGKIA